MQLVEQHIVTKTSKYYKECDDLCFRSKNLYNSCLYFIKNYVGEEDEAIYNLYDYMKKVESYEKLPSKVSQGTIILVKQNIKAFKAALKSYRVNPKKFKGEPEFPHFLHKIRGRFLTTFNNQAVSKKVFKKAGKIKLSSTKIEFTTKIETFEEINSVRIVPNDDYYTIEVVYTVDEKEKMVDNKRYAGIDIGVSNLAAICTNDIMVKPIIINGRPLKSMNQYYNKKKAKIQSTLEKRNGKKWSKKLNTLNLKKKNKVDDYMHKASKKVVQHCVENKINTVIIGKNDGWKQICELGGPNNQNFIQIPHSRFIDMITYKCELEGISVITHNESHTSKCSFLDLESPEHHSKYVGRRVKRGLFKSAKGKLINADVNAGYNMIVKVVPQAFADGIEGVGVHPLDIISIK